MLAFDLETTGLDPAAHAVTCACAYDPLSGIDVTFFPPLGDDLQPFFALLDAAPVLCAFNGARFDIPFLQTRYQLPEERVRPWILKLYDVYEACRLAFGAGFSLNALLDANGLESKTGSGREAITLAEQGRWDELGAYCRMDTVKTYEAAALPRLRLPLRGRTAAVLRMGQFVHEP